MVEVSADHPHWVGDHYHHHHHDHVAPVVRYLVSVPDCQELLTPVYALLETRTQHYNQVLQLRGKLELLTRQAMDRQGDTIVDTEKQALLGKAELVIIWGL
jgi:hypothetical protein